MTRTFHLKNRVQTCGEGLGLSGSELRGSVPAPPSLRGCLPSRVGAAPEGPVGAPPRPGSPRKGPFRQGWNIAASSRVREAGRARDKVGASVGRERTG